MEKYIRKIRKEWYIDKVKPPNNNLEDFGWILGEDGPYKKKWFEGHGAPSALEISIT